MAFLTLLVLLFAPVPAEPAAAAPKGPPPLIVVAQVDRDGALVSKRIETNYEQVPRTISENVNGKIVTKTVIELVPVMRQLTQKWPLDKATITDGSGQKIDKATLAKRLAKPAPVVVSADGRAIDPAYLKMFQPNAIIVVSPPQVTAKPTPAPVPPPAPKPVPAPKGY